MVEAIAEPVEARRRKRPVRGPVLLALLCFAIVIAIALLEIHFWPFSRESITRRLSADSGDRVSFTKFRETYFPHPGCVAEGVTFERDASSPRLTASRLVIQASYAGLLHHYVSRMTAEGAQLMVPQGGLEKLGNSAGKNSESSTTIGEIDLPNSKIQIVTQQHGTLVFQFQQLRFESVSQDKAFRFRALLRNPIPQGDLRIEGQAGPFHHGSVPDTPISGLYDFTNAKLDIFPGIAGSLSSQGKLAGQLQAMRVSGVVDSPDFFLDHVKHPVNLHNDFQAVVNGTNGDVRLDEVRSHYRQTTILSLGTVASDPDNGGKAVALTMSSASARIQDLLWLFVSEAPPAVNGPIALHARVLLPNEDRSFLKRLRLQGDFVMPNAVSAHSGTQRNIEILSARARGQADKIEDDQEKDRRQGTHRVDQELEPVTSRLEGRLTFAEGVARFTYLSFGVPGAESHLTGTYNLLDEKVNLHGSMHMDTRLSHATTGIKSVLAKIIQPKTHKPGEPGSDVGVQVTGTYRHPSFAVQPTTGSK